MGSRNIGGMIEFSARSPTLHTWRLGVVPPSGLAFPAKCAQRGAHTLYAHVHARAARPKLPRQFFGTVAIDPDRAGRDMGDVTEEVLQNLTTLPGARVRVMDPTMPSCVPLGIAI